MFCAINTPAQIPTLVQHVSSGRDNTGVTAPTFKIVAPNPSLSGNCWVVGYAHDATLTTGTVTTDKGNTLTSAFTALNSAGQVIEMYFGIPTAGAQSVSITTTGSAAVNSTSLDLSEFYNTNCTKDVAAAATAKSVTIAPTNANDLIVLYGDDTSTLTPTITSITAGTSYSLLHANRSQGIVGEYRTGAASGSQSVSFTSSDADTWQAGAIALQRATAGTAPAATGIRIISEQGEAFGTTTHTMQFPSSGNLVVGVWSSGNVTLSSISSSPANIWSAGITKSTAACSTAGESGQIFYAAAASTGNTMTVSPTYCGTDAQGLNFLVLFDVTGAATSPHDVDSSGTGTQNTVGNLVATSIVPTTSNGLVFGAAVWFSCTTTGNTPGVYAGSALNSGNNNFCPTGTNASTLNEDDGRALYYNPNTTSVSFSYANTSNGTTGVGSWVAVNSAFKASATTASGPPQVFILF